MRIVSSYKPDHRFQPPTLEQEPALESSGLLIIAAERLRGQAREALLATPSSFESYHRAQVLTAAFKSVERAAARAYEVAGFPVDFLEFTPADSMDRTSAYKESLSTVGLGGLVDASSLDAARKAIQHELDALTAGGED